MRRAMIAWALLVLVLIAPAVSVAAPPARPLPLTAAQFDGLRQIQAAEEHVALLHVRASYSSEHEAQMEANLLADDITTGLTQAGWPAALLTILLIAL